MAVLNASSADRKCIFRQTCPPLKGAKQCMLELYKWELRDFTSDISIRGTFRKVQAACLQSKYVSEQTAVKKIEFLLDTGAECSIISHDAWLNLQKAVPGIALEGSPWGLELADGTRLQV